MITCEPLGATYSPDLDRARLNRQQMAVFDVMRDGCWRSLRELSDASGAPEASASARLRDLRRMGWTVERRRVGNLSSGLFRYRLVTTDQQGNG